LRPFYRVGRKTFKRGPKQIFVHDVCEKWLGLDLYGALGRCIRASVIAIGKCWPDRKPAARRR